MFFHLILFSVLAVFNHVLLCGGPVSSNSNHQCDSLQALELNGQYLEGREVHCEVAREREDRTQSAGKNWKSPGSVIVFCNISLCIVTLNIDVKHFINFLDTVAMVYCLLEVY
jgi:hypothetical protein